MDPFISIIAGVALIGGALFVLITASSRQAEFELNKKLLWQERCSGSMGIIGMFGIPGLRVSLYDDFMVVAFFGKNKISYCEIAEVKARKGFQAIGMSGVELRIRGLRSSYVFRSHNPDGLVKAIKEQMRKSSCRAQ